jgi:hypothetical protein
MESIIIRVDRLLIINLKKLNNVNSISVPDCQYVYLKKKLKVNLFGTHFFGRQTVAPFVGGCLVR